MRTEKPPFKVLHITEHGITLSSGYGFRSLGIFRAQRDRGWQPIVLTFRRPDEGARGPATQPDTDTVEGIRCYYRPVAVSRRLVPSFARWSRTSALAKRIHEVAGAERPALLHAHSPVVNGAAALKVGRRIGLPVVYEVRSLWEEAAVAHGTYGYESRQFQEMRSLETWVCENVDHVVTISNGLKSHLAGRGIRPDKISVASNGVDCEATNPGGADPAVRESWNLIGKEVVGYIGSFRHYEGLDLLVKTIAQLSTHRPNVVLLLVGGGRGDVESDLRALVERLELRGRVIMPGWLPAERIPGVYALMDVLAYPRKRMLLTEIVTPLKPLEAMAMGKAVIASDVGGHRELVRHGHTGLLFPAGSEAALGETVSRLLDDHDLRRRLVRQAAAWVRRERSWSTTISVYSEAYEKARQANRSGHVAGGRLALPHP